MVSNDEQIRPGSEIDAAIERALESANLRAGDATSTTASVVDDHEPSAVELGDGPDGGDGD